MIEIKSTLNASSCLCQTNSGSGKLMKQCKRHSKSGEKCIKLQKIMILKPTPEMPEQAQ